VRQAERLRHVPAYPFARWAVHCREATARGLDLIRLDAGDPDLPPPVEVVERLCVAARRPTGHGYPGYRGRVELRRAIAAYYARRFGVSLDPEEQVVPLLGSKEGIIAFQLAILNPGDTVLVPDPGYAPYASGARLAGGDVVYFSLREENGFLPDFSAIPDEVARRTALLWLNYPNNPTGATAELDSLTEAVEFARRYDILLCHDAPYADVSFGDVRPPSLLQVPGAAQVAVEFNSLSKTFNMAGWRAGMAVGRPDALALLFRIKSNIDSGIFSPIQEAATAALGVDERWITSRNEVYRERLEILQTSLSTIGLETSVPRATLYLWARLPPPTSAEAFALRLLNETGISVSPGTFFGSSGEGYIRVSVTESTDRIREAARRLGSLPTGWARDELPPKTNY